MGIHVLGPMTVDGSGRLGPHDRVVLQALATRPGRPVTADELIDAVWGDGPPPSAAKNLQTCVVKLRKVLGADAIETSPHGYVLALSADHLDAHDFEAQVTRARGLLTAGESDRVAYLLEQALALWRGPAFADLPEWPPARREAGRLGELRLEAQEMHVDAMLRSGRPREVLAQAQTLVRAAPLRERRWELLVLAQYQTGAQGEALRSLRQLRAVLSRELGIDPAPEMLALEQSILNQDPRLLVPQPRSGTAQCPWQGLKAYDVDDTERFFGRDQDVRACLDLLRTGSIAALVGPSGCGKSSIMRAGVLAALRGRGHRIVLVTPGRRPTDALSALAEDADSGTVLAVDQTEEVFALCDDQEERRAFLDRLAREVARRPVILTLRGDRLSQVTEHPAFSRLVERGLHLVGSLDEEALRAAVTRPAEQAGLVLQPGLVDLLVREVRDDPGALPLLSHALQETWRRREGNTLTVDGYHASGGIHGAVAQSAEQLYGSVPAEERNLLRDLVLRLVSPGIDGEPVRTQVPRRLIASDAHHEHLVGMLVDARLVTSDEGVLEITHEALARAWPRLRGWLDDDVEGQRIRHHLSGAADAWNILGRPDSELYRGVRLTRALEWQSRTESALTEPERDFLAAAMSVSEAEEQSAAERARAQTRMIRRLRVVLGGAAVLLVLALAAGGIAAVQSDRANEHAARSLANETSAEARRAGAQALITEDIGESMLLAVAGVRLDDSTATRGSLLAALARRPELVASTPVAGKDLKSIDVSPDGRSVATYDEAHRVRLHRIATGELVGEYAAGDDRRRVGTTGLATFAPDGRTLAVVGAPPTQHPVRLLDATTLEPLSAQPGGLGSRRWQVSDLTFSQDGRRLAAVLARVEGPRDSLQRTSVWAFAWDLSAPGRPVSRIRLTSDALYSGLALSPDGSVMFTTGPFTRHDLVRRTSRAVAGDPAWGKLRMSPDGRLLVASVADGSGGLALLDGATGAPRQRLPGGGDEGWNVAFSADGTRVATVMYGQGEGIVWEVATGAQAARFPVDQGPEILDLSSDGSVLYAAGSDGSVRHWDVDGADRFLAQVVADKDRISSFLVAQPAPRGPFVAVPSLDDVGFLDLRTGTTPSEPLDRTSTSSGLGTWHPDGVRFAHAGDRVTVWDASRSEVVDRGRRLSGGASGIDHTSDGSRLVVSEPSGRVTMLDAATLEPVGRAVPLGTPTCCVAAGPDNRTAIVLTGSLDTTGFFGQTVTDWVVVDLESGSIVDEGELGFEGTDVAISPDGRQATVGGRGGEVMLLDLTTREPLGAPRVLASALISNVSYSPDGRRIVTSGEAASVAVLDARTGQLVARVATPEPSTTAVFGESPDSVLIASRGNGPIWQWDTDIGRAVDLACRIAGRDFTTDEWAAQFGTRAYQETCPGP